MVGYPRLFPDLLKSTVSGLNTVLSVLTQFMSDKDKNFTRFWSQKYILPYSL